MSSPVRPRRPTLRPCCTAARLECAHLETLLAEVRAAGGGGALVVRGVPGVGKSALLDWAAERAAPARCLRAAGVRVGAGAAVRGAAPAAAAGARRRRRAARAAGRCAARRTRARSRPAGGTRSWSPWRCSPCSAEVAAERGPAVPGRRRAVGRLGIGRRAGVRRPPAGRRARRACSSRSGTAARTAFAADGLPELAGGRPGRRVGGRAAGRGCAPAPDERVTRRLVELTGGNALALVELPARADARRSSPARSRCRTRCRSGPASSGSSPGSPPRLPDAARRAADGGGGRGHRPARGDRRARLRGARAAGRTRWPPAEEAGLVRIAGGRVEFRHPLVRSAVYQQAVFAARRAAHRALAAALDARRRPRPPGVAPGRGRRRAGRRAAAALEESAARARRRAGPAPAAAAFARAAALTAEPVERGRRLVAAAEASWTAGRHRGRPWRCSTRPNRCSPAPAPGRAARAARARSSSAAVGRTPPIPLLVAAAGGRRRSAHRAGAARPGRRGGLAQRRRRPDARARPAGRPAAADRRGRGTGRGRPADRCRRRGHGRLGRRRRATAPGAARAGPSATTRSRCCGPGRRRCCWATATLRAGCYGRVVALARADRRGRPADRPRWTGSAFAHVLVRPAHRGRAGRARGPAAGPRARPAGRHRAGRCWRWSRPGAARPTSCREHAEAALAAATGTGSVPSPRARRGRSGCSSSGWAARTRRCTGWPGGRRARPRPPGDRAVGHPGSGRGGRPGRAPGGRPGRAGRFGPGPARSARRGRSPPRTAAPRSWPAATWPAFAAARWSTHDGRARPLDLARTQLHYGEALRRARRRVDARVGLRAACETFDRLGAVPWAERARDRAARHRGDRRAARAGRARPADPAGAADRPAGRRGASNPEIAAQLFLSRKTVEYHLHKVFTKLGLAGRSRARPVRPRRIDCRRPRW